jgi:hypothetical protein
MISRLDLMQKKKKKAGRIAYRYSFPITIAAFHHPVPTDTGPAPVAG